MHEPTVYYALIGDIVGSRDLPDRAAVQRNLERLLRSLNEELQGSDEPGLATPIKLTAGDEVQVLLSAPARAVDLVVRIADGLHPATIAWGLGAGPLTTDVGEDVAVLDGPCFHHARDAVEAASEGDEWLRTRGFPTPHGESISALFRLMGVIRARWKPAQMRYIRDARTHLQKDVAALHDVDESTVSKALQAARFRDVEQGEAAARDLLRWIATVPDESWRPET
jgi:hypothetical protein